MKLAMLVVPLLLLGAADKLEVTDLKVGKGPEAKDGDLITVLYRGTLTDGTEFDSSKDRAPFNVVLGQGRVIKGWDQGLVGAKAGGKRKLVIPPELGYGDRDLDVIPPNSTLIFEIDVLKIYKKGEKQVLEITEIEAGEGQEVKAGDTVNVNYKGTFLNGKSFDSGNFSFKVGSGQVIQGFDQGVTGMKKGGKRKVVVPPDLGYGARGAGSVIPPNSTLVFELEVVEIK
jgi:peptidylprolyl isomerase